MPMPRRRRRRVAAVAAKRHYDAKHQQDAPPEEQYAPPEEQYAPPPAAPAPPAESGGMSAEAIERLKELGQLHEQNVLTDEEFEREKAKLL